MLTNQKLLTIFLIVFVIGASIYFTFTKFKQVVSSATASPSPSTQQIKILLTPNQPTSTPSVSTQNSNQTNTQSQSQVAQATPLPTPQELMLEKNKHLSQFPGVLKPEVIQNKKAVIETAKGNIEIQIYLDAPAAASNFILLAANGFYNNLTFHRVEPNFVVQGGDPSGNGTGGPGYSFPDEQITRDYKKGTVAMANSGPNTNGSQFFIMLDDHPELPKQYTIFGQVIRGQEVVDKIVVGDVMQKVTIQNLQ